MNIRRRPGGTVGPTLFSISGGGRWALRGEGECGALGDLISAVARRLETHERFDAIVDRYIAGAHERREVGRAIHPTFLKSFARELRSRIGYQILLLDITADPDDPDDGPTFTKIMAAGPWLEGLTQRTLTTTLSRLAAFGFVGVETGRADRRLRIYRPTERMYDYLARSLASFAAPLAEVVDTAGHVRRLLEDRAYLQETFRRIGEAMIAGHHPAAHFPALYLIFDRDHGKHVVALVVESARRGGPTTLHRIARTGGVPLAQVREIIRHSADAGLVVVGEGGTLCDASGLQAVYARYVARELAFFVVTAPGDALKGWRRDPDAQTAPP